MSLLESLREVGGCLKSAIEGIDFEGNAGARGAYDVSFRVQSGFVRVVLGP